MKGDTASSTNIEMLTKTMFRLLPVQILLAAVGAVTGIVSAFFANNYVGIDAMSAVGLYGPIQMLIQAVSTMLTGGSVILCGQYMGQNAQKRMQNIFSLNLVLSFCIAAVFAVLFVVCGTLDLTGFLTRDPVVRPIFNQYLIGQAVGVLPLVAGNQLSAFLSLENRGKRNLAASLVYIIMSILLNALFVRTLHMEALGLALASSLGCLVFCGVQMQYFLSGKSHLRISLKNLRLQETIGIVQVGLPGALASGYQTARGLIVNWLLEAFVGSIGISAFATVNSLLGFFWAVPLGMLAVSRMMISVSIGEQDRQTLTDIMRVMFRRFLPLMCAVSLLLTLLAVPMTQLFFRDPSQPVYEMTVHGFRILPWCMPLAVICTHFVCYWQAGGKMSMVHLISLLDGVVCVAGFTALLIGTFGQDSVYIANVLNGIVCILVIAVYAWIRQRRLPRSMDELMGIPDSFGVPVSHRIDLSVSKLDEVLSISREIQTFCQSKGVDERRAYLSGLAMEEMAGNIVEHGFEGNRHHSIDVRVVYQKGAVILRLKDDCRPFDPSARQSMFDPDDPAENIGIRMVFKMAEEVQYQNILGMNVLTIRI